MMSTASASTNFFERDSVLQRESLACLQSHLAELSARIDESTSQAATASSEELDECTSSFNSGHDEPVRRDSSPTTDNEVPVDRLAYLARAFELTTFEQQLILLCAGVELESSFIRKCTEVHSGGNAQSPTYFMASRCLPGAHLSALAPDGALRRWRMLEVSAGESLHVAPLRLDERILFFLCGSDGFDERLTPYLEAVPTAGALPDAYRDSARCMIECWMQHTPAPVVLLDGPAPDGKFTLAAAVAHALELKLLRVRIERLPTLAAEAQVFLRLCQRETILQRLALLLVLNSQAELAVPHALIAQDIIDQTTCPTVIVGNKLTTRRAVLRLSLDRMDAPQQLALWEHALFGSSHTSEVQVDTALRDALRPALVKLVNQFSFEPSQIQQMAQSCLVDPSIETANDLSERLWEECRYQSSSALSRLGQPIRSKATWKDLILSDDALETLYLVAAQVRQSHKVHEHWGFANDGTRGLGVTALLEGPSGTGKTLAAEVLAHELSLDLFRIDLSQVISKYIGETEKNLSTIFEAAENSGAILLFDEADALFGKRSEVKDSHDRYANIEVSYLLQRMEAYSGLALLTTNHRHSLDVAFMRRITFVITFGFPDAEQRERIWRNVWPPTTPMSGLDFAKLARLNVTGGSIRNIALNAAFLAADAGQPVQMQHLLRAARSECRKIEKGLTAAEIGGWV